MNSAERNGSSSSRLTAAALAPSCCEHRAAAVAKQHRLNTLQIRALTDGQDASGVGKLGLGKFGFGKVGRRGGKLGRGTSKSA